jgi:hypothetical protein
MQEIKQYGTKSIQCQLQVSRTCWLQLRYQTQNTSLLLKGKVGTEKEKEHLPGHKSAVQAALFPCKASEYSLVSFDLLPMHVQGRICISAVLLH